MLPRMSGRKGGGQLNADDAVLLLSFCRSHDPAVFRGKVETNDGQWGFRQGGSRS